MDKNNQPSYLSFSDTDCDLLCYTTENRLEHTVTLTKLDTDAIQPVTQRTVHTSTQPEHIHNSHEKGCNFKKKNKERSRKECRR